MTGVTGGGLFCLHPADPGAAVQTIRAYDALGRVVEETVNGYTVESAYVGARRAEIEYPGRAVVSLGHTAAGTFYYHTNNLYNVRALTDETGAVVERYRYSAYGSVTILDANGQEITESAVGNVYMFQGRRLDPETSLYYYRNRMMSAELGRFLQRDPLGYVDGWNLYEYVGGNPLGLIDPQGLQYRRGTTPPGMNPYIAEKLEAQIMGLWDAIVNFCFGGSASAGMSSPIGSGSVSTEVGFRPFAVLDLRGTTIPHITYFEFQADINQHRRGVGYEAGLGIFTEIELQQAEKGTQIDIVVFGQSASISNSSSRVTLGTRGDMFQPIWDKFG